MIDQEFNLDTALDQIQKDPMGFLNSLSSAKAGARVPDEEVAAMGGVMARIAETPDGQAMLQWLMRRTLHKMQAHWSLGRTCEEVAMYGNWREGQNDIVHQLIGLIAVGRGQEPKGRST